jgi:hypothetical protein
MPRRRVLPKNTEVIMRGEPVLVSGGGTIKALSAEFLFDLQKHWRKSREQVLDLLSESLVLRTKSVRNRN